MASKEHKNGAKPAPEGRSRREMRTGWLGAGRRINPVLTRCIENGAKPAPEGRSRKQMRTGLLGAGRRMNLGLARSIKNEAKPAFEELGREKSEDRIVWSW